jgi:hypothetical protein
LGEPRVLSFIEGGYNQNNNLDSYNDTVLPGQDAPMMGTGEGFINIGTRGNVARNNVTLILDNNITLKGSGTTNATSYYNYLIMVNENATLVLRKGAIITKHHSNAGMPIYVSTSTKNNGIPTAENDGKVRIEGGSITDCDFSAINTDAYKKLIYFKSAITRWYPGSFYMAESTADNPITFSGNTNNVLYFYASSPAMYNLSDYLDTGLSLPASN